jgi:Gpi18-like mannosyltransferase
MKRIFAFLSKPESFNIILILAVLFRLVLIPSPGFEADVAFWKSWGLAVKDYGIVKGLPLTNFNYPTPFAYSLSVMAYIYSFFADPHNYNEYWNNANLLFLAIAKAPSIFADFGIFAIILWIGKKAKKIGFPILPTTTYLLLATLYLLNPLPMFDGAQWGQVDSVGVFLFLLANCMVFTKKPLLAGVIYMVAMMTKLQNMIYGPVFFLFIWQYLGFKGLMQAAAGAAGTFLAMNFEFIAARKMDRVAVDLTGNYDYFPWLSLNAYNVWWIVAKGHGMDMSDKIAAIGMLNAKTVGLYMFASTYLLGMVFMVVTTLKNMWNQKIVVEQKTLFFRYFSSLIIVAAAFFLFQTESHDRYAFPICVFLLLWVPFWMKTERDLKLFTIHYSLFTILFFYNIHNAMIQNYPKNGIPILNFLNVIPLTLAASWLQIGLFFGFLYVLRKHITIPLFILWVSVFFILILAGNRALITGKPVPITSITPITSTTGYGQRMVNMPVNASFGFSKWGFLSVQYAYYKHGLGTHAPSREVFDINGNFKTLSTDFGVDTNGGPQGSVQFLVYGDGKLLFASELIKRYEFPRHAEVPIAGVKSLELIVSDGDNGKNDDHADWLNTYLIP